MAGMLVGLLAITELETKNDAAVYEAGPTGSKCTTGRNAKWTGLCSLSEKY